MKSSQNATTQKSGVREPNPSGWSRSKDLVRKSGGKKKLDLNNPLYERPGFLLWRARHIANSIFTDECREFSFTSPQYLVLATVKETPGTDQVGVSRIAGLDRFTTALVLSNLIKRKLIARERSTSDRRRYVLRLSPRGLELLKRIIPGATRARQRLMSPFAPREQKLFIALLQRLVTTLNNDARAPVDESGLPYMQGTADGAGKKRKK
jgi:MarR family transcriptional regulator, lower aerobic nicotinate degradation pathway regulator